MLEYVEKRPIPATVDRTPLDRGTAVHLLAERYVKGEEVEDTKPLRHVMTELDQYRSLYAQGLATVEQEWAFGPDWTPCGWFDRQAWNRVKCDVVLMPEPTSLDVIDWKTGKKYGNEVKHTRQGQFYAVSAFMRYPKVERVGTVFHYVDHKGQHLRRTYVRADVPRLLAVWDSKLREVTSATEFPAKPNANNCRYCPYGVSNGGDGSCGYAVPV